MVQRTLLTLPGSLYSNHPRQVPFLCPALDDAWSLIGGHFPFCKALSLSVLSTPFQELNALCRHSNLHVFAPPVNF